MSQLGIIASSINKPVASVDFKMEITTIGASESFTFPFFNEGSYNGTINFGDGGGDKSITAWDDADKTNIYATADTYIITLSGIIGSFIFGGALPDLRVDKITQWGTIPFTRMDFNGCSNMTVTATDIPDLSNMTSFLNLFNSCSSIVTIPNLNSWDTSTITVMTNCFIAASSFNMDISGLDVSSVTIFQAMFDSANSFNTTLNGWTLNPAGGVDMTNMFFANGAYNSSLSSWDMTKVTNTTGMFRSAFCVFNHSSINSWNVSNILNMTSMFEDNNTFNQPLNSWTPTSCTTCVNMFENADAFNQDVSAWNLSSCTNMQDMFRDMANFNNGGASMDSFGVAACVNFVSMFQWCVSFNQSIDWTLKSSGSIAMQNMLVNCDLFSQDLSGWNMDYVTALNLFMNGATGLSPTNYGLLLTGWDAQTLQSGVTADFGGSTYTKTQVDSGTTDGVAANKLIESGQNFTSTVAVNDIVHNTTDDTYAKVTAVDSDTQLSLNADIMVSGETYQIETSAAVKAKENMINSDSWTIVDGGGV